MYNDRSDEQRLDVGLGGLKQAAQEQGQADGHGDEAAAEGGAWRGSPAGGQGVGSKGDVEHGLHHLGLQTKMLL